MGPKREMSTLEKIVKNIIEVSFWVGALITLLGVLIASVGIYPNVTKILRPDIYAAENAMLTLQYSGFVKLGDPGFELIVEQCICTLPQYSDFDCSSIEMVGEDYSMTRRYMNPDRSDIILTVWRDGRQTALYFSYRTLDQQLTEYIDKWKGRLSINYTCLGVVIMIFTKLLGKYNDKYIIRKCQNIAT